VNWEATASGRGFFSIALFSEFVITPQTFSNFNSVASPMDRARLDQPVGLVQYCLF
jgi:hypothetical protein